jgi:hypothetical protein
MLASMLPPSRIGVAENGETPKKERRKKNQILCLHWSAAPLRWRPGIEKFLSEKICGNIKICRKAC